MGVIIEAGVLRQGTPLCVPSKAVRKKIPIFAFVHDASLFIILCLIQFVDIGIVTSIEMNHKPVDCAKKGQEICIKIEPIPGESPKMYGRHFEATDIIVSKVSPTRSDDGGSSAPQPQPTFSRSILVVGLQE